MKNYAVACSWFRFNHDGKNTMDLTTDLRLIDAISKDEARGKYLVKVSDEFSGYQINGYPIVMEMKELISRKEGGE